MGKETGGYAFPKGSTFNDGMTLRDYFAAKAMQGFCSNQDWLSTSMGNDPHSTLNHIVSRVSYALADAMLEARK